MTQNEIAYANYLENVRSHKANELLTEWQNKATYTENNRHNRVTEELTKAKNTNDYVIGYGSMISSNLHQRVSERQQEKKLDQDWILGNINAENTRYGAELSAAATRYRADAAAAASRYSADQAAASSKYNTDTNAFINQYRIDTEANTQRRKQDLDYSKAVGDRLQRDQANRRDNLTRLETTKATNESQERQNQYRTDSQMVTDLLNALGKGAALKGGKGK